MTVLWVAAAVLLGILVAVVNIDAFGLGYIDDYRAQERHDHRYMDPSWFPGKPLRPTVTGPESEWGDSG